MNKEIQNSKFKIQNSDIEPKGPELIPGKPKLPLAEQKLKMEMVTMPEEPRIPYGIEETTDVVEFLTSAANAVMEALNDDGKITLKDYPKFFAPATKIFPALTGIGQVPKELNDLQPEEKAELIQLVKDNLSLNDNAEAIVAKAFDIAFEIKELADLIKQSK